MSGWCQVRALDSASDAAEAMSERMDVAGAREGAEAECCLGCVEAGSRSGSLDSLLVAGAELVGEGVLSVSSGGEDSRKGGAAEKRVCPCANAWRGTSAASVPLAICKGM